LFEQLVELGKASISDVLPIQESSQAASAIEEVKRVLQNMGPEIVPDLIAMLGSGAGHYAAAVFDQRHVAAVPLLLQSCKSPDLRVRRNAISALRYICISAETKMLYLVQPLSELTLDSDGEVRGKAVDTLLDLCGVQRQMVERYREWLHDSYHLVRVCGIRALGALSLDDDLPALTSLLNDNDSSIVRSALASIALYGERARVALPTIQALVNQDPDGYLADAARDALKKVAGEGVH
jgi:HEAT repeat protein